ncbi:TadE family type IV pilus minor pilin, partial [Streptomyces sp. NPDC059466]|uniref:TadE family type IV pilus minor pilin n=1 Tax=Streptomyces sp. NPDC059466 TaxID=3346843 RepID=UPI0036B75EF7
GGGGGGRAGARAGWRAGARPGGGGRGGGGARPPRAGARSAARQDPPETVLATARRAAPDGARVTVSRTGDLVRVEVTASAPGPDALSLELSDVAVALSEETVGVTGDGTRS